MIKVYLYCMMQKIFTVTLFIFLIQSSLSQKKNIKFSYIGIEAYSLLKAERITKIPLDVINSEFYQKNFDTLGKPSRTIFHFPVSNQIGITAGIAYEGFKLIKFEYTLSFGYQNSGNFYDSVYNIKNGTDNSGNSIKFQDARVNMEYSFNEFYYSTALMLKTKFTNQFNFYIGYGFCFTHSKPKIKVKEFEQNILTNEYETNGNFKRYIHNQIPIGIEYDLDKKKEEGIHFLINYTGRISGPWNAGSLRSFSSLGISIIYKL